MDIEQVKNLALLARLDVRDAELATVARDLGSTIGMVDEIKGVDVSADNARDLSQVNVFRDDVVAPLASVQNLVDIAPDHADGFVKVPKVLGE